ncbi:hypothetical protein BD410DRAFT_795105 [Rickenella mellea]|uniref:Uncharacterized protein n=1 Tax=Rickenella mellea TaxID=50990 RepID=A0A4Y7PMR6_9AGAM|nr:hypothetical protein BD410DRAFT_795105 [Rickenella mellea]
MPTIPPLRYVAPPFSLLALAGFYFIVVHMVASKAPLRFLEVHKASQVPLALTHISLLDKMLTPLVSFFIAAFGDPSSPAYPTTIDFVWSFGSAIQLPLIEAQRVGMDAPSMSRSVLAWPMIWGVLYQRVSGGWILPLWLLAFMRSKTRAAGAGIGKIEAESVFAGWWLGHTIPALAMLVPGQSPFTRPPIWIAFPILMSLAQHGYYCARRSLCPASTRNNDNTRSGYVILQLTYLSAFVLSCIAHIHSVIIPGLLSAPAPSSIPTHLHYLLTTYLYNFFIPPTGLRIPSPESTTAASGVRHFVQWDVLVVFAAVWLAGIWDLVLRRHDRDASKKGHEGKNCVWAVVGFVGGVTASLFVTALALGPGAATAGLYAYRESVMEEARARRRTDAQNGVTASDSLVDETSRLNPDRVVRYD